LRTVFCIILFLVSIEITAQIRVSIFNSLPVNSLIISPYNGVYDISCDDEKIAGFTQGKIFYISLYNNSLLLNDENGTVGWYEELTISPENETSKLQIALIEPKARGRNYSGAIHLKIEYGRILILNNIHEEQYIAGVVEAESGINAASEFYKAQALLCRTYMLSHLTRHETEGFNLCDEVHCQAYKGSTPFTESILKSTFQTAGKIITDETNEPITAAFHANCGGETESALNIWLKSENYLIPVRDPYCQQSQNANWEKKIHLHEWKKYLKGHGFNTQTMPTSSLELKSKRRQSYYRINKDSMLLKQIRTDWNLKSSFFQIHIKNNTVHLTGHGYGHGVGLCQDGAMNMARKGLTYPEIINFYFKKVKIVDYQ
jgi:stage II sporulation protein D